MLNLIIRIECFFMKKTPGKKHPLIGFALRQSLKAGYSFEKFRHDLIAALVVSLVALPLSMALAIAVGLPPQHGIYTAIVAGIAVPLLGGSITQVSGPTAAFVVIIAPIVAEHGLRGLIIAEIMAGIMLILMGIARFGRLVNYVPYPVTTGFTAGIAVVLATLSMNDFLGLGIASLDGSFIHKLSLIFSHLPELNIQEAAVGIITVAAMIVSRQFSAKIPSAVFGIIAGTAAAYFFIMNGFEISTIGNKFSYEINGVVKNGIPPFPPEIHLPTLQKDNLFSWPTYEEISILIAPAMVIAALAALESLLSATVADSMARTKHGPNSELCAIGFGNILSGLASGIPATGAIARTATNIRAGAKTPFASSIHAILIMLYVLIFARYISYVPMASLAGLLIITAYHMSHYRQCINILNIAPRSDKLVLAACFILTVFVDMVAGVTVGIVLASMLFMKQMAKTTETSVAKSGKSRKSKGEVAIPASALVYRITGPLFFGTAEKAFDRTSFVGDEIKTLIIDMEDVPFADMTAIIAMKSLILNIAEKKKTIVFCGRKEITSRIARKIAKEKAVKDRVKFYTTVKEVISDKSIF